MSSIEFEAIATIHSPYKEKFAVPRQPGLVPTAKAELEILPPYNDINAFSGLAGFSHLWLVFVFHKNHQPDSWSPTVRPPRLGGNKRMGVFATRSPIRPNPIGLSLVEYHGIIEKDGKIFLQLSNIDLVEGTPIIDIKPYIPYADAKIDAIAGYAQTEPCNTMEINFSTQAKRVIQKLRDEYPELQQFITEVLQQDPRPAYNKNKQDPKIYAVNLSVFNVSWKSNEKQTTVINLEKIL